MGLLDRGKSYQLPDREPEKRSKKRKIQSYKSPKALSGLSCVLLLLLAAALLCYGTAIAAMRFLGVEAEAAPNTRLVASGAVTEVEITSVTSTLYLTFRDSEGTLREGSVSLLGNQERLGELVKIRYFPRHPQWLMLSSRTDQWMLPIGSLLMGVLLIRTAAARLRELKRGAEETPGERGNEE